MKRPPNPFEPNKPISPSQFIGREKEVAELDAALEHLQQGIPRHFLVTGYRGVGKTSFLDLVRNRAGKGHGGLNFLVLDFVIDKFGTQLDLIKGIEDELARAVSEYAPFHDLVKKAWCFIQRIEAAGVSLRSAPETYSGRAIYKDVAEALIVTVEKICDQTSLVYGYDGVVILLDEVDQASSQMDLGTFLKYVLETLNRRGCNRVAFGLAGLASSRDVLLKSHLSSLRIFDELPLDNLGRGEFEELMSAAELKVANSGEELVIDAEARELLFDFSDGHPHFVQQLGYCAFEVCVARPPPFLMTVDDVRQGAMSARGAIDLLGDMYFRPSLEKIEGELAMRVLDLLTESPAKSFGFDEVASHIGCSVGDLVPLFKRMCELAVLRETQERFRVCYACFAYWFKIARPLIL